MKQLSLSVMDPALVTRLIAEAGLEGMLGGECRGAYGPNRGDATLTWMFLHYVGIRLRDVFVAAKTCEDLGACKVQITHDDRCLRISA